MFPIRLVAIVLSVLTGAEARAASLQQFFTQLVLDHGVGDSGKFWLGLLEKQNFQPSYGYTSFSDEDALPNLLFHISSGNSVTVHVDGPAGSSNENWNGGNLDIGVITVIGHSAASVLSIAPSPGEDAISAIINLDLNSHFYGSNEAISILESVEGGGTLRDRPVVPRTSGSNMEWFQTPITDLLAVPEPSTAGLLFLSAGLMFARRRGR